MLGAIVGDIIGAPYENSGNTDYGFPVLEHEFTDDTVCTAALWDWLLNSKEHTAQTLSPIMAQWVRDYPNRGYGGRFQEWVHRPIPYGSIGNGCAMRCSPISLFADTPQQAVNLASESVMISHNHPESAAYTQITALVGFFLIKGYKPLQILPFLQEKFPEIPLWNQEFDILGNRFSTQSHPKEIAQHYYFVETVALTVLPALSCLVHAHDFESGVRLSVALGGDSDTLAAIVGAWMECQYGVGGIPNEWLELTLSRLDDKILGLLKKRPEYGHLKKGWW